jgi:hypothetical protein
LPFVHERLFIGGSVVVFDNADNAHGSRFPGELGALIAMSPPGNNGLSPPPQGPEARWPAALPRRAQTA